MGSSREGRKKKCELSDYVFKLRQRLQDALSLGIRLFDDKVKRWECADAEIQSHALRTMVAFIECISSSHLQHPVIQESTKDMLVALGGILQSENERILSLALTVVMNLVNRLGNYIRQYHIVEVVFSLSRLLPLSPSISVIACGVLNRILTNLGSMRTERSMKVWNALEDANTVGYISLSLLDYMFTTSSSEYFTEMASLLHTILWKWPPSRFSIWGNKTLMTKLGERLSDSDPTILICVLRLCSALALCGNGATKLLENEVILLKTSGALESSQVLDVRVEATKFFQLLLRSQEGCSQLASTHIYSIFRGMIAGMSEYRSSGSIKVLNGQFLLAKVACQTALTTCRAGCYHPKLWDLGIDSILLDVLVGNKNMHLYNQLEDQLEVVMTEIWDLNREIRCNVWDILGCLAVNCAQDFPQTAKGKTGCLHALINIACSVAHELLCRGDLHEVEPVLRTVLLMVFSPCKHISIQARTCMSKLVRSCGKEYLGKLLASLQLISKGDISPVSNSLQTVLNLMSLACYSALLEYQQIIVQRQGIVILSAIIERCLNTEMNVSRSSIACHLDDPSDGELCCWSDTEDWEGGNLILFYSLQSLSQLIPSSNLICNLPRIVSRDFEISNSLGGTEVEALARTLTSLLPNKFSHGTRWYAGYILSFFGLFGFPSHLGKRLEAALSENELADIQFLFSDGLSLRAHGVILAARCPRLMPSKQAFMENNNPDSRFFHGNSLHELNSMMEMKMSERVDMFSLMKILEFVYTGFILIEEDMVRPLRSLAKRCGLSSLSHMLHRKSPPWGAPVPAIDLGHVLEPMEELFWNVTLESNKVSGDDWTCSTCVRTEPHAHAHKIVLWSNCEYLRALFHSGMKDSHLDVVKVPVSYIALTKLVKWLYTGKLPRISIDCRWNNMATIQQMGELQPYVELCFLGEFWFMDEIKEDSLNMVLSCLEHNPKLSMEIVSFAADHRQWSIVQAAVSNVAHLYPRMHDSGELERLGEVSDLLRTKYVELSQKNFLMA